LTEIAFLPRRTHAPQARLFVLVAQPSIQIVQRLFRIEQELLDLAAAP